MNASSTASEADPSVEGGAMPGARLLGLVQRMMRTGMAMARCVNRIAWHRLAGQDLARLAPAGFNPTLTNALVVEAVGWTAALRERLRALAVRPALAPELPKAERGPHRRGGAFCLPENMAATDDWHDWPELARPWRMGSTGVAVAAKAIAGLPDREVVSRICDKLRRAAAALGAEADVGRIAALEAAARALCPEGDAGAAADAVDGGERACAGEAGSAPAWGDSGAGYEPPPAPD